MSCCKPVIATAYSGNMEFMNHENSFLVPYSLVEIEKDHGPYKKGSVWADPDRDQAAQFMLRIYEDRVGTSKIASRGRDHVLKSLHPRTIGDLVKKRLVSLNLMPADLCTVD
jgi:hypothetical protein